MLTVETIRKIRLSVHRDGKSIRQTSKDLTFITEHSQKSNQEWRDPFPVRAPETANS